MGAEITKNEGDPQIPEYELIKPIGKGGFGDVWLAKSVLGTFLAVKVIFRSNFRDDRSYEREFNGIRKFEPISRTHPGFVAISGGHFGQASLRRFPRQNETSEIFRRDSVASFVGRLRLRD